MWRQYAYFQAFHLHDQWFDAAQLFTSRLSINHLRRILSIKKLVLWEKLRTENPESEIFSLVKEYIYLPHGHFNLVLTLWRFWTIHLYRMLPKFSLVNFFEFRNNIAIYGCKIVCPMVHFQTWVIASVRIFTCELSDYKANTLPKLSPAYLSRSRG